MCPERVSNPSPATEKGTERCHFLFARGDFTRRSANKALRYLHFGYSILLKRPILNIRQLEAALDVPYRTAQRYIERLEGIGILREVTGQARNRLFRADEILQVLDSTG